MRSRLLDVIMASLTAVCVSTARSEETPAVNSDIEYRQKLRDIDSKTLKDREAGYKEIEAKFKERKEAREKASQPQTAEVTVDDKKITVTEPRTVEEALGFKGDRRVRDLYEVSPDDYDLAVRDRWAINLSDFKFDAPHYITAEAAPGSTRTWFGFTFSLTNNSTKPRRIAPVFTAVTDRGVFNVASGGYLPERMLADSMSRPLGGSTRLDDKELVSQNVAPLESVVEMVTGGVYKAPGAEAAPEVAGGQLKASHTFEPGQTRWGSALWSKFDDHFSELKIVVSGVTNSHKHDEKLQRVLVLYFERNSDGFNVNQVELKYKGKKWEYLWMWDQDIAVPLPADAKDPQIKAQQLKTPSGSERFVFAFPFEVKNSTHSNQDLSIQSIAFALPIEVDVSGTKVPVEVRVMDDGASSIYKAQLLKELGGEATKDRFSNKKPDGSKTQIERHTITVEAGKSADKNWAIFDQNDVNWDAAIEQIEAFLSRGQDKQALSKQFWDNAIKDAVKSSPKLAEKNPGHLYNPIRTLNEDEIKSVKEQIAKALPEAVEKAKAKKTVVAYVTGVSGMSTGEFRISRSYRIPGVVDEAWLKGWEDEPAK
ncbi:MAG: hypothetical protein WCT04_01915 [Planctomycetota bacterium]